MTQSNRAVVPTTQYQVGQQQKNSTCDNRGENFIHEILLNESKLFCSKKLCNIVEQNNKLNLINSSRFTKCTYRDSQITTTGTCALQQTHIVDIKKCIKENFSLPKNIKTCPNNACTYYSEQKPYAKNQFKCNNKNVVSPCEVVHPVEYYDIKVFETRQPNNIKASPNNTCVDFSQQKSLVKTPIEFNNKNIVPPIIVEQHVDDFDIEVIDTSQTNHHKVHYSETDIRNLHEFVDSMYREIKRLIDSINSEHQDIDNDLLLAIDLKKVKADKVLHFIKEQKVLYKNKQKLISMKQSKNVTSLCCELQKPDTVQAQDKKAVGFIEMPLHNINPITTISEEVFKSLDIIIHLANHLCKYSSRNVPSLCMSSWHFQNITQGYLLRFLLKNANVNTLNVMRTIYFVLITANTPNLSVQMNVEFKNGIFKVYSSSRLIEFSFKLIEWNNEHKNILIKYVLSEPKVNVITKKTSIEKSGYVKNYKSEPTSYNEEYTSQSDHLINATMKTQRNSTFLKAYRSVATHIMSRDVLFKQSTADKSVSNIFQVRSSMFQTNWWHYKLMLSNIFTMPRPRLCNSLFKCNYFNETIFENISLDRCVQSCQCFRPKLSSEFYILFFKCLGHTVGCTVLSFLISLI